MQIHPAKLLSGTASLPGDKSISHRAAMIGSIAVGTSIISNYAASADCRSTLDCMSALGVKIEQDGSTVTIHGKGFAGVMGPKTDLDCGNSGTTMRLLSGILAGCDFSSTLIGDASLSSRPMKRIMLPLEKMGAEILADNDKAPLRIVGRSPLKAIEYETPVASAQIKSCVLLAGLFADGKTTVIESTPSRDHSERMLAAFGAEISSEMIDGKNHISIYPTEKLTAADVQIPGDVSAAAFFVAAAAALPGSEVVMKNVGLNPTRTAFLEAAKQLGADIDYSELSESGGEPTGTITVRPGGRSGLGSRYLVNGKMIANLIDEVPVLAVLGTQFENGIEIRDAAELRVKESDRISTVVQNLRRMGADVEEFDDGMKVGRSDLRGSVIETFGDHRIAMAFAVAGLFAEGTTTILDPDCVNVSFPGFYGVLKGLVKT